MKREGTVWGVILILVGLGLLAARFFPAWFDGLTWPWFIIGLGALFLLVGLLTREGGFLIPAAIVAGVGGILLWQTRTGDWDSWAYMWTLIPGFIGFGMLIGGLIDPKMAPARSGAFILMLISLIGFGLFGGLGMDLELLRYWPVLLIGLGVWFVIKALVRRQPTDQRAKDGVFKNG
jgi:hypothetical protein